MRYFLECDSAIAIFCHTFLRISTLPASPFWFIFLVVFNTNPGNSYITSRGQSYELKGSPRPLGSIWPRPQHILTDARTFPVATAKFEIELLDATKTATRGQEDTVIHCPLLDWVIGHYTTQIRALRGNEYQYQSQPSNPNKSYYSRRNNSTRGSSRGRKRKPRKRNQDGQNNTRKTEAKPKTKRGAYKLRVYLQQCTDDYPQDQDQDYTTQYEKYTISTQNHGPPVDNVIGVVHADSGQGVMRALESLYQMLWPVVTNRKKDKDGNGTFEYFINSSQITDFPRFIHRGLLLDTARHFLPEKIIRKILTGMMYNKLNVFHWHIVDDQSFPFESRKFPELSRKGAYHKNAVYTAETIQGIIKAAGERGIRVIFEFDTPGHVGAIRKSHQELLTPCGVNPSDPDPDPTGSKFGIFENLDPSNEKMYDFIRELFTEIIQNVTKDKYIHLGMDEVNVPCWEASPKIKKFMKARGLTSVKEVLQYYTTRHVAMVKSLGAKIISWQDAIDIGVELDKDIVIHVWKDWRGFEGTYKRLLSLGYKVLLSSTCWYINYINYGESWRKYYECDPYLNGQIPESQKNQVLGGEGAIWGEFVDATNIIPRIFPFVGGISSALWDSNIDVESVGRENIDDAMFRLDAFRCSILQRGIEAQPIYPGHCGAYETQVEFNTS